MGMTAEDRKSLKGSGTPTTPLAVRIRDAAGMLGVSVTEVYRLLAAGKVQAVKHGVTTLVLVASLHDYLSSLPAATFRTPHAA